MTQDTHFLLVDPQNVAVLQTATIFVRAKLEFSGQSLTDPGFCGNYTAFCEVFFNQVFPILSALSLENTTITSIIQFYPYYTTILYHLFKMFPQDPSFFGQERTRETFQKLKEESSAKAPRGQCVALFPARKMGRWGPNRWMVYNGL